MATQRKKPSGNQTWQLETPYKWRSYWENYLYRFNGGFSIAMCVYWMVDKSFATVKLRNWDYVLYLFGVLLQFCVNLIRQKCGLHGCDQQKKWTPWSLKHGDNDLFKYLDQLDKWRMEKWYPIIIHDEYLNIPSSYFPYDFWIVPSHCSGKMYPSGWGSCWSSPGHWKGMTAEVISRVVSIVVQWCFNLIHVRSWAGLLYTLFQCVEAIFRCFQPFQVSKTRVFNVVQATPCHASDPFGHCFPQL